MFAFLSQAFSAGPTHPPHPSREAAGLPKAKPRVLYVIGRLDLGQLEISRSGSWGDAVPACAGLQLPKLAGWPSAASPWLQSHVVPSPSTGTLGCWLIPFTLYQAPMRVEVPSPGRGMRVIPQPHTLQTQSRTHGRA